MALTRSNLCIRLADIPFGVSVTQQPDLTFTVTYGAEVIPNLDYATACKVFGECTFHSLTLAGHIAKEANHA